MHMFSPTLVAMPSLLSRGQAKPDGTWWLRSQGKPSWVLEGATGVFAAVNDSTPWCPTRVMVGVDTLCTSERTLCREILKIVHS